MSHTKEGLLVLSPIFFVRMLSPSANIIGEDSV